MQRASGRVLVSVKHGADRTRLERLHQSGCLRLRLPRVAGDVPHGVLINTAGGLTGGDRLEVEAVLAPGARLALASQTAERLYRSPTGAARVDVTLRAGADARLAWLPQETIAFEGAALRRTLDVSLAEGARFLGVESVVLGREAMGETVRTLAFRDDWRIRLGGRLLHAEAVRIGADAGRWLERAAGLGQRRACATVLLVSPDAPALVREVRELAGEVGAADAWTGPAARLVVRLLAHDGHSLRLRLAAILAHLNSARAGLECASNRQSGGLPAVWSL